MAYYVEDKKEKLYRAVEAMYHKGYSIEEIERRTGLSHLETLDTVQKIFALSQRKLRREAL